MEELLNSAGSKLLLTNKGSKQMKRADKKAKAKLDFTWSAAKVPFFTNTFLFLLVFFKKRKELHVCVCVYYVLFFVNKGLIVSLSAHSCDVEKPELKIFK